MASIKPAERDKGTVYVVRVRVPGDKTVTKTFDRLKEAQKWAAAMEGDKARSKLPSNVVAGRVKFGEYAAEWMTLRQLRPKTVELYDYLLRLYILPDLGDVALAKITTQTVRRWHSSQLRGRDPKDIKIAKAYRLLRAIMNTAVEDGIIAVNPCQIRGAGVEESAERTVIEPEQVFLIAENIAPHLRALVLLAAFGGLRRGELLALKRRNINLREGTVTVESQVTKTGTNRRVETDPKTRSGVRTRPLPPFLVDALREHMATYTGPGRDAVVFVGTKGGPLSTASLNDAWNRARKATGIDITLHDLRHASGTFMAWNGATTRELMAHLGHASPAAAMRYQHAAESRAQLLASKMDDLARGAMAANSGNVTSINRAKSVTKRKSG